MLIFVTSLNAKYRGWEFFMLYSRNIVVYVFLTVADATTNFHAKITHNIWRVARVCCLASQF